MEALAQQLSDDSFRTRQQAEDQLVAIGAAAEPFLKRLIAETEDPEVRSRAQSALQGISHKHTAEPTLVSLHLKNAPLDLALKELKKQTGFDIATDRQERFGAREKEKRITIDVDRQPYWEVVRQVCAQSGWSPMHYDREGTRLLLSRGGIDWSKRPVNLQGQFMVIVEGVRRHESLEFDNPDGASRDFAVSVDVFADPKLRIVGVNPVIDMAVATDDKGNSLVVKEGKNKGLRSTGRQDPLVRGLQAPLQIRSGVGNKLVELKGVARFLVRTKSERWDLGNPLKLDGEQKRVVNDTLTLTLKSVAAAASDPKALEVKIGVAIKRGPNPNIPGLRDAGRNPLTDFHFLADCLKIVDVKGRSFRAFNSRSTSNEDGEEFDFTFSPNDGEGHQLGEPARMIWDVPVEIKEVEVPVEFKDLPLP